MNRTQPRRTSFGVESLERRELTAIYMKVDGVVARPAPAEVQIVAATGREPVSFELENTLVAN